MLTRAHNKGKPKTFTLLTFESAIKTVVFDRTKMRNLGTRLLLRIKRRRKKLRLELRPLLRTKPLRNTIWYSFDALFLS